MSSIGYRYFKVIGYNGDDGEVELFYKTSGGEDAVTAYILGTPLQSGGLERYSLEEIPSIPEKHLLKCPHCGESYEDARSVIKI